MNLFQKVNNAIGFSIFLILAILYGLFFYVSLIDSAISYPIVITGIGLLITLLGLKIVIDRRLEKYLPISYENNKKPIIIVLSNVLAVFAFFLPWLFIENISFVFKHVGSYDLYIPLIPLFLILVSLGLIIKQKVKDFEILLILAGCISVLFFATFGIIATF